MKYVSQPCTKNVHIGDIWLAKFIYIEGSNYGKLRPVLIKDFDDDNEMIKVQMITTKDNKHYSQKKKIPFKLVKKDERCSYLVDRYEYIPREYLFRRMKSCEEIKRYKLNED